MVYSSMYGLINLDLIGSLIGRVLNDGGGGTHKGRHFKSFVRDHLLCAPKNSEKYMKMRENTIKSTKSRTGCTAVIVYSHPSYVYS
eukprot:scaffold22361_cov67-Skeletonema_marinoi.AAC.1